MPNPHSKKPGDNQTRSSKTLSAMRNTYRRDKEEDPSTSDDDCNAKALVMFHGKRLESKEQDRRSKQQLREDLLRAIQYLCSAKASCHASVEIIKGVTGEILKDGDKEVAVDYGKRLQKMRRAIIPVTKEKQDEVTGLEADLKTWKDEVERLAACMLEGKAYGVRRWEESLKATKRLDYKLYLGQFDLKGAKHLREAVESALNGLKQKWGSDLGLLNANSSRRITQRH